MPEVLHNICNMGSCDLPDMSALALRHCTPSGSCVHIRQITPAHVTYITCTCTVPTLVLQSPALATFSLQVRISLHSYVVSYVTYKLSVCKQLLTSTHEITVTPASITLTGPSITIS